MRMIKTAYNAIISALRRAAAAKTAGYNPETKQRMEQIFCDIYRVNAWGNDESVSGPGSTMKRGAAFIDELAHVLRILDVRSLLDAPCGDFNWVAPIAGRMEKYLGIDIVKELVLENERRYGSPNAGFLQMDVSCDPLPRADAILCRDCLVHFSHEDIWMTLNNVRRSQALYFITTTFVGPRENENIKTGGWRPLNLQRLPFCFPEPLRLIDEHCDHTDGAYADKRLGVWRVLDLPETGC